MKKILLIVMLAFAAQIKSQCFEIQSILVDACDGGNEGKNEMVIFQVGSTALNTANLTVAWPNNSWLGLTQNAGTAADIATVNATIIGCGLLKEPVAGVLPANSKVLLITSTAWNPLAQSFVNLSDTFIVIFQTAGNTAGHFVNYGTATPLTRTLNMSFSVPAGCSDAVTYDRSQLLNQSLVPGAQDGGAVEFTPSGIPTYVNHGCQAPYIPLSVDAGVNKTVCINSTLSLTATPTGNYNSVNWSLGAGATGSFSPTNSLTTVYTPGASDNNTIKLYCSVIRSCTGHTLTAKDSLNVTVNQIPSPSITTPSTTICSGQSSILSYSLSNAGSTGTTSVQWLPSNLTTSTISVNTAGSYSVTLSNACGNKTSAFTLSVNPLPTVSIAASGLTQFCAGGSVTYTANSNTSNYNWTGGITTQTISVNTTNTIIVTSTNSCGTATATQATSVIALPIANAGFTNTLTCTNSTLNLSGSGGGTYVWTGPSITSGSNTATPTINTPGTYSLVVTSAAGCASAPSTVAITQNTTAPSPTASNSTTLTCITTTATLTGTGGGSYNWSGPGITAGGTTSAPTVNLPGTYVLTVTATNGCTATASTAITQNTTTPSPTATNSTTLTCSTTTATLTGTGGGSYNWSGPGITAGGTTSAPTVNLPGTYALTVTAANGCTAVATTSVTQNSTTPSPTASNSATLTCNITTATLTGTGGGSYNWSGPGITAGGTTSAPTVNLPGTYVLTVTATNGCTATASTAITQNTTTPSPTATNSTTLTCSTTTATLTGSGGGSYNWSGPGITAGGTTSAPTVNLPGTYVLTVTATNGCTATANTSITQNTTTPSPTAINSTTLTCSTTTATLTGTGGGSYNWSGPGITAGGTTSAPTVNLPGTYVLSVTATNGCTATASTAITQNTTTPSPTATNSTTLTCSTTTATLTGTGGGSYNWSGSGITAGGTTSAPTVNLPGTYALTVTAANGCTAVATTSVTQNTTTPSPTATNSTTLTCSTTTATLTGTGGGSYNWSGPGITAGGTTSAPTVNLPGTYILTVTATNGCTATANTSITQNTTAPLTTASTSGSVTCVTNTVNLSSSLAGMNYTWTAPGGSSIISGSTLQNAVGQGLGTYSLNVFNPTNNCTYSTSIAAIQNTTTPTSVNAGANQTLVCGVPTVTLSGSASPVSAIANWLGGVTTPNSFTTTTGSANTYTLQAINPATGCAITSTVLVSSSLGAPTATINAITNSITCTNSIVTIGITPTSAGPFTYQWPSAGIVGSTTNATATATLAGVYNVTLTNSPGNNCSIQVSISVPINTTAVTASISPTATITCNTPSLTLSASPVGAYTYTWSGSSAIISGGSSQNPIISNGGTYSVAITNTINGCVGNASISVASNTILPVVTIAAPSVTTSCTNPTVTIVATGSPSTGVTYSWTAPSSGSLNTYTVSNPIASGSGIFTVVVTNTASGCSSSLTQNTVQVNPDLAIPVVSLTANSLSITCANTTASVAITSTSSPLSYSWSPTAGIASGATTANPIFNAAGSYSVVVTNTSTGCATNITSNVVDVVLDNTIPTISLSNTGANTGTISCTNTLVTISPTVTPNSNVTYTWLPSGVSSSSVTVATFTTAGTYTLVVTNTITGCASSLTNTANAFTVVADNTTPTFTLGTASSLTTTCAAPNANLSASSNADPSSVYTWTTPTSSTLTGNPITSSGAGTYSVIVTNTLNGCSTSFATVNVADDAGIPTGTLSLNTVSITCANPTPSVALTTTTSPVSFSWTPNTGIVAGTETSANPIFNAAGSYSVVITNTISGCASGINNHVVDVVLNNTIPIITLSTATNDGTITCNNLLVNATPTVMPSSSDLTYSWLPSAGLSTAYTQANATFTAAGIYTLAVTNTLTGCVSSSTNTASIFTVYVNNITPTITATPISSNTIIGCSTPAVTFSANVITTGANLTYLWSTGASSPTVDVTSSGVYSFTVTDSDNGCFATSQFTVNGNTMPPQNVNAGSAVTIACGSSSIALNGVTTSTNVSYSWSGPSSTSILSGSNTTSPIVNEIGIYTFTVTDNATGCQSTASVSVSQANVTAAFTADPITGTSPLTVNFTDASTGANNWIWNFGDASPSQTYTSTPQGLSNVYTSGSYTVTLIASSGSCTSTATLVIVVEDGFSLEVPNVFTPNNDGANDVFTIKSTGVKEISLQIFNRWGEKLYEFTGAKAAWDGVAENGGLVPDGTYFYFVKATGFDGKTVSKNSYLNLFR